MRSTTAGVWIIIAFAGAQAPAGAQTIFFDGSTNANWLASANWAGNTIPGPTQVAQFGAPPSGGILNIAMNSASTNNGPNNQAVGAMWITPSRTTNWTLGNNSITANGIFTLNGTFISGVGDTALYHNGGTSAAPTTMTFQNFVGSGNKFMDVMMPNGGNIRIRTGDGLTGANFGNTIQMDSSFHALQHFTVLGGGNGSNRPGTLFLNSTGNTLKSFTIGSADGLDAGRLRMSFGYQPDAGNYTWTINPHSQLALDGGGIGFWPGDTLVLKSMGLASAGGNILHGGLRMLGNGTIPGLVRLEANSGIHNEGTLTLNQGITQSGGTHSLTKTGAGNLILSQASSYGDTFLNAGSITIDLGNNRLPTTSNLTIASGASLILGTSSAARSQTLRSLSGAGSVVGTATSNSTLTLSAGSSTFTGLLGGTGTNQNRLAVNVNSGAILDLARPAGNTYLGNTSITGNASLRVSNTSGSATGTGNVSIAAGCTLDGLGSFSGNLTGNGTIAPGLPSLRGVLTAGNTTLSSTSTLALDFFSASDYDALSVVGSMSISNAALSLTFHPGFTFALTDRLWILRNDGADAVSGTFAGLPEGSRIFFPGGGEGILHYKANFATGALTGGNDIVIAIPAPGAAALLGLAALAVGRRRRT